MRVSVILPIVINHEWQRIMTQAAIDIMRENTEYRYNLYIVETGSKNQWRGKHLHLPIERQSPASYTKDFNKGIDSAKMHGADIIIQMANDIFVMPGWLEALIDCFKIEDCGAATLSSIEANHPKTNVIRESWSFPVLMAWRKETESGGQFRFDENFRNNCSDTDLIMQIYNSGFKMYRNFNVQFFHLIKATFRNSNTMEDGKVAINRFKAKWAGNPTFMFDALSQGLAI